MDPVTGSRASPGGTVQSKRDYATDWRWGLAMPVVLLIAEWQLCRTPTCSALRPLQQGPFSRFVRHAETYGDGILSPPSQGYRRESERGQEVVRRGSGEGQEGPWQAWLSAHSSTVGSQVPGAQKQRKPCHSTKKWVRTIGRAWVTRAARQVLVRRNGA